MRGKDRESVRLGGQSRGSPPRAREGLTILSVVSGVAGITPACAGRTLKDPVFCNVLF